MITCITINLKYKLFKSTNLKITNFLETRINNENYKNIINNLINDNTEIILIEDIVLQEINNKEELINFFQEKGMKVIILTLNVEVIKDYLAFNFYNIVNLKKINYEQDLLNLYKSENNKDSFFKSNKVKISYKKFVILAVSLDHKVYSTTFLINLAFYLSENREIFYFEKNNSIIDLQEIYNFKEFNISYLKIENMQEIISHEFTLKEQNKIIQIIDYGTIKNVENIKNIAYDELIVFTTNCKTVNSMSTYKEIIVKLEKFKNANFLCRNELFNVKFQKHSDRILKIKKNKKFVKKHLNVNKWKI